MATKTVDNDYYRGTDGKDTITVTAKQMASVYGEGGNDKITVKRGKKHWVEGGSGNDTIIISGGTDHRVYGDDGNDTITVKKGGGFYVLSGLRGKKNTITVQEGAKPGTASSYGLIYGGTGNDVIKVTNKKGKYYDIDGGEGNDTITVKNGSYYEIDGDHGKDIIKITNVKHFTVNQHNIRGKDQITVTGGSNGYIYVTDKGTATINSGSSHTVSGSSIGDNLNSTIIINGGKKLTIEDSPPEFGKSNEKITVNGGAGKMNLETGTDTITFDFKNKTKIGNWNISVSKLKNNRLTVLNARSTEFTIERKVKTYGLANYVVAGTDRWIMTHKTTGKSVVLSGWGEYDAKTFDIYFKKDNKLVSSVPVQTDWKKVGL
jgi:Hemolysin-type calcium-binding repeat (2 copies).